MFPYDIRLSSYMMSRAMVGNRALHSDNYYPHTRPAIVTNILGRNGLAGVAKSALQISPSFSELFAAHLLFLSHRKPYIQVAFDSLAVLQVRPG